MRALVPLRGSVLCRKVRGGTSVKTVGGIAANVAEVDVYEILRLPEVLPEGGFPFKVGDLVLSNSTGDAIEVNPGETVYLFKTENVMCRVVDNG